MGVQLTDAFDLAGLSVQVAGIAIFMLPRVGRSHAWRHVTPLQYCN
jgi:hypothetical protein